MLKPTAKLAFFREPAKKYEMIAYLYEAIAAFFGGFVESS